MKDKPEGKAKGKRAGTAGEAKKPDKSVKHKGKPAVTKDSASNALNKNKNRTTKKVPVKRKRAKPKPCVKKPAVEKEPEDATKPEETNDPFEAARQTVKGSVQAIVKKMVEKAKEGSCTHAKTLLEMTGAKHMFDSEAEGQDSGEPWAKLVLERLDEAERGQAPETADAAESKSAGC